MPVRVLIVDDDPLFSAGLAALLRERGYEVAGTAGSLADARTLLGAVDPDAMLLDVNLPDGDGIAFAASVAQAGDRPRIVLASSDPGAAPAALVRRSGAAGFVAKADLAVTDLAPLLGKGRP